MNGSDRFEAAARRFLLEMVAVAVIVIVAVFVLYLVTK